MDLLTNPIIVLVLALLGVPMVTSGITGLLKQITDQTGIPPKVVVYVVSVVVTGLILLTGAVELPAYADDPSAFVIAWATWLTANAEIARRVYEIIWERLTA